ncbi:MAG: hypothetical protein JWP80_3986 [Pseudomonas sp.]|nr:hypothetical protein [Pseudomonas sp.]
MVKITPDPPQSNPTPPRNRIAPRPSRATEHGLPDRLFLVRSHISAEEALTTASEILDCAAATAYESAEQLDPNNRKLVVAVAYLLETAQELVEAALAADRPES